VLNYNRHDISGLGNAREFDRESRAKLSPESVASATSEYPCLVALCPQLSAERSRTPQALRGGRSIRPASRPRKPRSFAPPIDALATRLRRVRPRVIGHRPSRRTPIVARLLSGRLSTFCARMASPEWAALRKPSESRPLSSTRRLQARAPELGAPCAQDSLAGRGGSVQSRSHLGSLRFPYCPS
jgi:hypothetical protein